MQAGDMDSKLIPALVSCNRKKSSKPWPVCSFDRDFILISEFSELVGPKPVLTIPEDGGASFNTNAFAVRIMSVDCTAPLTIDCDSSKAGFQTVGDTQVFLVEPSEGAFAYVHHFTLYDVHARGYVRPYCMAYITNQYSKIMDNFAVFRDRFSRISANFKFGNALIFLQDLQRRFDYLQYTKRKLSENLNGVPIGKVYELPRGMKGFNFEDIKGYIDDTVELKKVILQYLQDDCFDEQRQSFTDRMTYMEENLDGSDDIEGLPCLEKLTEKYSSLEPWSVGISSGRRFDVQLRDLSELCEPCKEEAFSLLKNVSALFSRKEVIEKLSIKSTMRHDTDQSKGDAVDSKPTQSRLVLSNRDVFLGTRGGKFHPVLRTNLWESDTYISISSCDRSSFWTISSCPSRSNSFEVIKVNHGSSDEDYVSLKDSDSVSSTPVSVISFGSSGHAEHQTANTEQLPGTARRILDDAGSANAKKSNDGLKRSYANDEVDFGSPRIVSWEDGGFPGEESDKQESEKESVYKYTARRSSKEVTNRQMSIESSKSSSSTASGSKPLKAKSSHVKVRSDSKNSSGSTSSKSSIPSLPNLFQILESTSNSFRGHTLVALRKIYSFFPHLIYSLMIGRPLIVAAERSNKHRVHSLLAALLPCVPSYPQNRSCVILWTKGPLHISNLATVKLVGLAKSRSRGDPVPPSILPYVSLLDLEASTLTAPPYHGKFLSNCFDPRKEWPSESVFIEYLQSAFLEMSNHATMVFTWQFLGHSESVALRGNEIVFHGKMTSYIVNFDVKRFLQTKFSEDDVNIIHYLVRIIKDAFLCDYVKSITDGDHSEDHGAFSCVDHTARLCHSETPSVKLNILKCQVFTDVQQTKKK